MKYLAPPARACSAEIMGSLYVLLAIFLWSSQGAVVRLAGVDLHVLIFYSMVVSVIAQGVILTQKRYRERMPDARRLKYPVMLGVLALANTFTFFFAFQNTTIANAVLTHYTAPIIVALLAPLFLKERITPKVLLVICIASVGLVVMMNGFKLEADQAGGILSGLVSGITYAVIIIFLRMHSEKFDPVVLAFFTNITVALMLAPFVAGFPTNALWSILLIGIVHSTIAPILYYRGLQQITANKAAVLGYIEPVCAIVFGILLLGEIPGLHSILGGTLIIFSGYLTVRDAGGKQ
jgi:drug/metabolite transporter (DMT)-like permease